MILDISVYLLTEGMSRHKPDRQVLDRSAEAFVVPTEPTPFLPLTYHKAAGMLEGAAGVRGSPPTTTLPGHHEWSSPRCQPLWGASQAACKNHNQILSHMLTGAAWVEKQLRERNLCSFMAHSVTGRHKGGDRNRGQ